MKTAEELLAIKKEFQAATRQGRQLSGVELMKLVGDFTRKDRQRLAAMLRVDAKAAQADVEAHTAAAESNQDASGAVEAVKRMADRLDRQGRAELRRHLDELDAADETNR